MMKGYIWVLLFVVLLGCNVSSSESKFEFDWQQVTQFNRNQITAIHVSSDDDLYVATGNKLFRSIDRNSVYVNILTPDSADIIKVKTFNDRILIIGNVFQRDIGNFGDDISHIYQSTDDGLTWEDLIGGFIMQDVTFYNDRIHIGKRNGVTTLDLTTGSTFFNEIVDSKLNDEMEEIEVSPDGLLAVSCHEGVFISEDNGVSWNEIGTQIRKDDDWIEAIEFNGNEIFALESSRVYRIDLISGDVETHKGFAGYEQLELTSTGELIKLGGSKLGIANQDNLSFANIYPSNVIDEQLFLDFVDSFSDGTLAITADEKLFIGERIN